MTNNGALPGKKTPWDIENPKWREDFEAMIVESGNAMRVKHHAPPLTVKPEIAKIAQDWASHLAKINKTVHRPDNVYGENIFYKWHKKHLINGSEVTQSFYNEIKYYYPYFQKEPNLEHFHRFGHFSQLLWRESEQCGIGIAVNGDKIFIVINYHPRGNWPDEYAANVLPAVIASSARLALIESNPHPDHHTYIPPALRGKVVEGHEFDVSMVIPLVTTPILPAPGSDTASTINTTKEEPKENIEAPKEPEVVKESAQETIEPVKIMPIPKIAAKESVKLPKELLPKNIKEVKKFGGKKELTKTLKGIKEAPKEPSKEVPEVKEPEVPKEVPKEVPIDTSKEVPKLAKALAKKSFQRPKEFPRKIINMNDKKLAMPKNINVKDLSKTTKEPSASGAEDNLKTVEEQPKTTKDVKELSKNLKEAINKSTKQDFKTVEELSKTTKSGKEFSKNLKDVNKTTKLDSKTLPKDAFKSNPKEVSKDAFKSNPKDVPKDAFKSNPKEVPKSDIKEEPKSVAKEEIPEVSKEDSVKSSVQEQSKDVAIKTPAPIKNVRKGFARPQFSAGIGKKIPAQNSKTAGSLKVRQAKSVKQQQPAKILVGNRPIQVPNIPGVAPIGAGPTKTVQVPPKELTLDEKLVVLPEDTDFDKTLMAGCGGLQSIRARPESTPGQAKKFPAKVASKQPAKRPIKSAALKFAVPQPPLAPVPASTQPPAGKQALQKARPIQAGLRVAKAFPAKAQPKVPPPVAAEAQPVPVPGSAEVPAEVASGGTEVVAKVGDEPAKHPVK